MIEIGYGCSQFGLLFFFTSACLKTLAISSAHRLPLLIAFMDNRQMPLEIIVFVECLATMGASELFRCERRSLGLLSGRVLYFRHYCSRCVQFDGYRTNDRGGSCSHSYAHQLLSLRYCSYLYRLLVLAAQLERLIRSCCGPLSSMHQRALHVPGLS